jgi:hypothetical protein
MGALEFEPKATPAFQRGIALTYQPYRDGIQFAGSVKKRLIYIAGEAHSGSTATDYLLGRYLGRSCGQLVDLGLLLNPDGSLNERAVSDAKVEAWRDFLLRVSPETREDFYAIFSEVTRERKFVGYCLSSRERKNLARRFDRSISSVYEHLGCDTIIDSSKNVTRALGLQKSETCDVYVVHLIRNPLDFLTSMAKRSPSGRTISGQLFWLAHWSTKNTLAYLLKFYFGERYFCLDYKSVFLDPYSTLEPLFRELGDFPNREEFTRIFGEERQEPETVGGNRIRIGGPLRFRYASVDRSESEAIHLPARLLCKLIERVIPGSGRRSSSSAGF